MRAALALAVLLAGCAGSDLDVPSPTPTPVVPPGAGTGIDPSWVEVASGLAQPVWMLEHPSSGRLLVAEQQGRIVELQDNGTFQPWLDLQDRVGAEGSEQGLLGFAFHPRFAENGVLVVSYTDLEGDSVLARLATTPPGGRPDPAAEEVLLRVDQPFSNHNGGHVLWGPDGHLYYGLGDGGLAGDPLLNGQNPNTLLGSLLRIDVGADGPYTVPSDNPFLGRNDARPEVWAYGLRNPWRFHFDGLTGDLWLGDVGQDMWEEVNLQRAASAGGENYGWNLFEGQHNYPAGPRIEPVPGFVFPVGEYSHAGGHCSITMGPVVRDPLLAGSNLTGRALLADFCSGQAWTASADAPGLEPWMDTGATVSSFAEDRAGRVHLLDYAAGRLLRLQA